MAQQGFHALIESSIAYTLYYCKFMGQFDDRLEYERLFSAFGQKRPGAPSPDVNVWIEAATGSAAYRPGASSRTFGFPFSDGQFRKGLKRFTLDFWKKYQPGAKVVVIHMDRGQTAAQETLQRLF
jgi:hypothetical protein